MIPVQTTLSLSAQQSIRPEAWNKQQATVQPHRQHTTQRQRSRKFSLSFQQRGQHTRDVVIPVNRIMDSRQIISSSSRIPRTAHPSLRITILLFSCLPSWKSPPRPRPGRPARFGKRPGKPGWWSTAPDYVCARAKWLGCFSPSSVFAFSEPLARLAVCPSSSCLTLTTTGSSTGGPGKKAKAAGIRKCKPTTRSRSPPRAREVHDKARQTRTCVGEGASWWGRPAGGKTGCRADCEGDGGVRYSRCWAERMARMAIVGYAIYACKKLAEAIGRSLDKCIRLLMRGAPSFADHVRDGSRRLASAMPAFCVPSPMS